RKTPPCVSSQAGPKTLIGLTPMSHTVSTGFRKPDCFILQFPSSRALAIRIQRELDGPGWLVLTHDREHGPLYGDFNAALQDGREVAAGYGVCLLSSDGGAK